MRSNDLHELARRGEVPRISGKYYAHIQTVVCVNPEIPGAHASTRTDMLRSPDTSNCSSS